MRELLKQLNSRDTHPLIQFIKYGIAGGAATAVHIFTFYVFAGWIFMALAPDDPILALLRIEAAPISDALRARNAIINNVAAFMFSNMTAYLINVYWVFTPGRHRRLVEIGMFYLVSAVSVGLGSIIMGLLIKSLQCSTTLAFGAVTACSVLINFAMRKYVIFRR
ncbi:MAG: GtrA family protein [Kiritimatiellia bacterium]